MIEDKLLKTGAVATLTTGICMVAGMDGVYEAAEHIMGYPVWTHELPAVQAQLQQLVTAQHADFPIEAPDWKATLADVEARYGKTILMKRGTGERGRDPVSTLASARDGEDARP